MKNALFVGHFIPERNYEALFNYYFCKKLKKDGIIVSLFSDSWCDASEDIFGSLDELSSNAIFEDKFYMDPFQAKKGEKRVLSMLGLFKKVITAKSYDLIIISNFVDYGILCLLAKEYNIQIALLQFGNEEWKYAFDDYIYEICLELSAQCTLLLTSPSKKDWIKEIPLFSSINVKSIEQLASAKAQPGKHASLVYLQDGVFQDDKYCEIEKELVDFEIEQFSMVNKSLSPAGHVHSKRIDTIEAFDKMLDSTDLIIDSSEVFENNKDFSRFVR